MRCRLTMRSPPRFYVRSGTMTRGYGFSAKPCRIMRYHPAAKSSYARKEAAMEPIISNLVARFEKGSLSRRDLVQGLALLAASGTAASAQETAQETAQGIDFKAATIDHVSIQVADLQRSVEFYQKIFGFTVVSEDKPRGIIRLGNTRTLVSLNHQSPANRRSFFDWRPVSPRNWPPATSPSTEPAWKTTPMRDCT